MKHELIPEAEVAGGYRVIQGNNCGFRELNRSINMSGGNILVDNCCGQRFIGTGLKKGRTIIINGTPGNALGAYLDGTEIVVHGNAQDAVGDTMNNGKIVIHGNAGDALGYAMRGGEIFVKGDSGYRTGIHMKEYQDKRPVIVVGGRTGSFLGEYLAGGLIIVLGLESQDIPVGNFSGTGMHGGRIFIRTRKNIQKLPSQISAGTASDNEMKEIEPFVNEYAALFRMDGADLMNETFQVLKPNDKHHYKRLYTIN